MTSRLWLAALRCEKAAVADNLRRHLDVLDRARTAGCQLTVFPELSLTGSIDPARRADAALAADDPAIDELVRATATTGVAALFGLAERGANGALHISQAYAADGRLVGWYRKRHLGEGEDAYTAGGDPCLFALDGLPFGVAICAEGAVDLPFAEPAAAGASLVCFCAAPGLTGRRTDDAGWAAGLAWWESCGLAQAQRHATREGVWIALVGQAGATVDEDFPGLAALVDPTGRVVDRLPDWREGDLVVEIPL